MSSFAHEGASSGGILKTERGVASCGSDSQPPPPGGTGPRPPGTTTRTRGARCDRSGSNSGEGSAGPEPKIATVRAPGGGRPASWDARRLVRRLACRVTCRPNGCLASTRRLSALRHPVNSGERSQKTKPGRKKRAAGTRRRCLVLTLSPRHSGRAAIAARAGIHNHRPWVWIPGSRALPAPRNDARETRRGNEEVLLGANAFSCSFRPSRDTARAGMMRRSRRCPSLPADSGLNSAPRAGTTSAPPEGRATSAPFFCAQRT